MTQTNYKDDVFDTIKESDIESIISVQTFLNQCAREVVNEVDLRSCKRRASSQAYLFRDIYDYTMPIDAKDEGIIDIKPQIDRPTRLEWKMVPEQEFDRYKNIHEQYLLSVHEEGGVRRLRISIILDDDSITLDEFDNITNWTAIGDSENIELDTFQYVKGNASLKFDIGSGGGTTAGVENSSILSTDLSEYLTNGSIFVWVWITSATDLTNYILKIGSNNSNYYSKTVTTDHNGNAFAAGWNLLRFDLTSLSTTGSPDITAIEYVALYMTKDVGKINESDYRFDWLIAKRGDIFDILYYTFYAWKTSAGVYKQDSSAASDILLAGPAEYDLFIKKGKYKARMLIKGYDGQTQAMETMYKEAVSDYVSKNPSEAISMITNYS